jgi:hypothetical protein
MSRFIFSNWTIRHKLGDPPWGDKLVCERSDRSLKYAETLQQAQEGPAPILIRMETRAGHGAGKPATQQSTSGPIASCS